MSRLLAAGMLTTLLLPFAAEAGSKRALEAQVRQQVETLRSPLGALALHSPVQLSRHVPGVIIIQEPAGGGGVNEFHDAIDASCTNWNLDFEDFTGNLTCDTGNAAIDLERAGVTEGLPYWTGDHEGVTIDAEDICCKFLYEHGGIADQEDNRIGCSFGDLDDSAEGGISPHFDFWGDNIDMEQKYDDGDSVETVSGSMSCSVATDPSTLGGDSDWGIICLEGDVTQSSGWTVEFWIQSTDPCATDDSCQGVSLGAPDATMTASDCGTLFSGTLGSQHLGFYMLDNDSGSGRHIQVDGDLAFWECTGAGNCP